MINVSVYSAVLKGLTSDEVDEDTYVYGKIRLDDFLNGKDITIRQIYYGNQRFNRCIYGRIRLTDLYLCI